MVPVLVPVAVVALLVRLDVRGPRGKDHVARVIDNQPVSIEAGLVDGPGRLDLVTGHSPVERLAEATLAVLATAGRLAQGQASPDSRILILAFVILLSLHDGVSDVDDTGLGVDGEAVGMEADCPVKRVLSSAGEGIGIGVRGRETKRLADLRGPVIVIRLKVDSSDQFLSVKIEGDTSVHIRVITGVVHLLLAGAEVGDPQHVTHGIIRNTLQKMAIESTAVAAAPNGIKLLERGRVKHTDLAHRGHVQQVSHDLSAVRFFAETKVLSHRICCLNFAEIRPEGCDLAIVIAAVTSLVQGACVRAGCVKVQVVELIIDKGLRANYE
mmetsp:Transcript_12944/g.27340  ORF Transcript_12944/g.27340 Transcript_12944/m.27340 type:complete len:326 (-) Transcript_12944:298-1275(-)